MLLLTGATGAIGSRLLPLLLESGEEVRCLVREPRRLGERRVDVQIAMGDLAELSDPYRLRRRCAASTRCCTSRRRSATSHRSGSRS